MAIKELFYDNRPQVLLDPRASQRIDPRFKFTRDSTGTYVAKDGIIKTADIDAPRFDFDPASFAEKGLKIEPESTNKLKYSSTFTTWWSYLGDEFALVQDGTVAPAGTATATKVTPAVSTSGSKWIWDPTYQVGVTAGKRYTGSAYYKANGISTVRVDVVFGGSARFNISDGTLVSVSNVSDGTGTIAGIEDAGNGWYRCYVSSIVSGSYPNKFQVVRIDGATSGVDSLYLWGAQFEEDNFMTSLIPTNGSAVTRDADLLSVEAPLPASGSVYIDARAISAAQDDTLLSLKNSSNDKIDLAYISNTDTYDSLALIANYKVDGTSMQ